MSVSPYVEFTESAAVDGRKTQEWNVRSTSGSELGYVRFFGAWRAYCFYPYEDCIFNAGCLRDIATFCEERTTSWWESVKERRRSRRLR